MIHKNNMKFSLTYSFFSTSNKIILPNSLLQIYSRSKKKNKLCIRILLKTWKLGLIFRFVIHVEEAGERIWKDFSNSMGTRETCFDRFFVFSIQSEEETENLKRWNFDELMNKIATFSRRKSRSGFFPLSMEKKLEFSNFIFVSYFLLIRPHCSSFR